MPNTERDSGDRLDSWKEIAQYLGRSVRTVIRWEAEQSLPVHRQLHDKRGAVHAYKSELDAWVQKRTLSPESTEPAHIPEPLPKRRWIYWASAGVILAVASMWLLRQGPSSAPPPQTRPLTTYPGSDMYPALSPDGDRSPIPITTDFIGSGDWISNPEMRVLSPIAPHKGTNAAPPFRPMAPTSHSHRLARATVRSGFARPTAPTKGN
jgi:predicted DNA-binding transcriptional regulator AlpA